MSSMLLPGRPPLTRSRPSPSMAPSTLLSSATTRPAAKAPSALPLAGLAAAAAAAFLAARVLPGDEDDTNEHSRECPTCGGSGTVTCTCTRWSDSNAEDPSSRGCGSCGGSLRAACHHCGGGGRAVPMARRVHVERSSGPYDRR